MARDLNKVQLTGYLGADPEMRYTTNGNAITTFRVASGRQWTDRDGRRHEETEWFRVAAWDKLGEVCNEYLTKGTRVYVEGRLQTRKYTDRDGVERYSTEVIAQDMIILSPKGDRQPPLAAEGEVFPDEPPASEPARSVSSRNPGRAGGRVGPQPRTSVPNAPRNQPQPIESDDEIPF